MWTVASRPAEKGATTPYRVQVYLEGSVSDQRLGDGPRTNLTEVVLKRGRAVVIKVDIDGELFITADKQETGDSRSLPLYREAVAAFKKAELDQPAASEQAVPASPAKARKAEPNEPPAQFTISISPLTAIVPGIQAGRRRRRASRSSPRSAERMSPGRSPTRGATR